MDLAELFNQTFFGKIMLLLSYIPAEIFYLIGGIIVFFAALAIWRAIIGG